MSHRVVVLLVAALLAPRGHLHAQVCPHSPITLVLSGGGARGLAHVGVIQSLEARGIRPDLIVGTSMGAVVGGLYASGYSTTELEAIARALPFEDYLMSRAPRLPPALERLRPVIRWQQRGRGLRLESTPPRETDLNAFVSALFLRGNLRAKGDFDSLPIRFRAVATDFRDRRTVVLAHGDLARAVRASFAIPLVFSPETIDGRVLADGGLSANVPISVARAEGGRRLIVSDVSAPATDSSDLGSTTHALGRLLNFLFTQADDSLAATDLVVQPDLGDMGHLAFTPSNTTRALAAGREAAERALASDRCWGTVAAKPAIAPRTTAGHAAVVSGFRLSGGTAEDASLLRDRLGIHVGERIDTAAVTRALRAVPSLGAYDAVWLSAAGRGDTLALVAEIEPAPRAGTALGLAYDNDVGGRLWVGALRRDLGQRGIDAWGVLFTGGLRQGIMVGARRTRRAGDIGAPIAEARLSRDDVRRFASHDLVGTALANDAVGLLGVELRFASGWSIAAGAEGRLWSGAGATVDSAAIAAGLVTRHRALGGALRLSLGEVDGVHATVEGAATTLYSRAQVDAAVPFQWWSWGIAPRLVAGWSRDAPAHLRPSLGGFDGFPGLRVNDERHAHAAAFALLVSHRLSGPVDAHVEAMAGAVGDASAMLVRDRWLTGLRGGVGAATPVGRVRADYGVERDGHTSAFVRLGQWF